MLLYHPHRTAISRKKISAPVKYFEKLNLFQGKNNILDYGCGKGVDADYLNAVKYDPYFNPEIPTSEYDVVLLNYVLNVLTKKVRITALKHAWSFVESGGCLLIATRNQDDINLSRSSKWTKSGDGYLTTRQTFQVGLDGSDLFLMCNKLPGVKVIYFGDKKFSFAIINKS